jgi:hypothetical protein
MGGGGGGGVLSWHSLYMGSYRLHVEYLTVFANNQILTKQGVYTSVLGVYTV